MTADAPAAIEAAPGLSIGSTEHTEPICRVLGYLQPLRANAALIRQAPADLRYLLDEGDRLRETVERLREAQEKLLGFARKILDGYLGGEIGDVEGVSIEEWGAEFGLLNPVAVTEPCCEGCKCDEYGFPATCYKPSAALAGETPKEESNG